MSALANSLAEQFRKHSNELPGADNPRIVAMRERAFSHFESTPMPTTKHEDWKYTDIRPLYDTTYIALNKANGSDSDDLHLSDIPLPSFTPHVAVFLDDEFCRRLSNLSALPEGVELTTIRSLLQRKSTTIIDHMEGFETAFPSLNSALLRDGIYVDIEPGTIMAEPIHVVFLSRQGKAPRLNSARLIINGQNNSRCVIVESHYNVSGAQSMTNALTQINAREGASVLHHRIQIGETAAHHIGNVFATVEKDAELETYSFAFGGGIARIDVNADLIGSGANVVLNGLFMVNDRQHIDHHTRVRHRVPHTNSSENYKGIADGDGRGVFNGKIIVEKDAQKVKALQSSRNLLLADTAEIDTKPELEIYADDVSCAHGATVGQLDEDAFFYLRSRGIDEQTARSMLTFAFAAEIPGSIDIIDLREWLESLIIDRTHATGFNSAKHDE